MAERSIRPFVVGRKAWNFYASPKGAESSSIAYSIIETAKVNNLNVFKHLTYLFKELPNTPFKEESDLLEDYLPWSPEIVSPKYKKIAHPLVRIMNSRIPCDFFAGIRLFMLLRCMFP